MAHRHLVARMRTAVSLDDPHLRDPVKLYRGIAVHSVDPDQQRRWGELLDYENWDEDPATLGKHLQVGPEIIDHLVHRQGGIGRHWTTDPRRAEDFMGRSIENMPGGAGSAFPVVLEMDWDGSGLDLSPETGMAHPAHNWDTDDERTMIKGHPLKISGVRVNEPSLGGMVDVLNPSPDDPDFGHLHREGYTHPGPA